MIFIFGGAYQGKLTYALENLGVKTVSDCTTGAAPILQRMPYTA